MPPIGSIKNAKPKFIMPELILHPNIPKPLHGLNPRVVLGKEWWDEQRSIAYEQNNYCCWACGISKYNAKYHKWLEAHEFYDYDYENGEAKLVKIVALCHSCHNYIHSGRMQMLLQEGKMSKEMYDDILAHGDKIIVDNNLKFPPIPKKVAKWSDWHIIIEGKSYYTKFRDIEDWANFYDN